MTAVTPRESRGSSTTAGRCFGGQVVRKPWAQKWLAPTRGRDEEHLAADGPGSGHQSQVVSDLDDAAPIFPEGLMDRLLGYGRLFSGGGWFSSPGACALLRNSVGVQPSIRLNTWPKWDGFCTPQR